MDGSVWFGTYNGVSRYDGDQRFVNFTVDDGLASNKARALLLDDVGHLWVGTDAGISRYDGRIFQSLLRRDGLISNNVRELFKDRQISK